MPWWLSLLVALGALAVVYGVFLLVLVVSGRKTDARAFARLIPDCVVLVTRLVRDPRVPRHRKVFLLAVIGYLASPIDLVPDFIPIAGQLDDAIVVALVLRSLIRSGGADLIHELWPGSPQSLSLITRFAGPCQ